jgi:hypothetical protein
MGRLIEDWIDDPIPDAEWFAFIWENRRTKAEVEQLNANAPASESKEVAQDG